MFSTKKFLENLEEIKNEKEIGGCITGSCLMDADFEMWTDTPDIDVYVYSLNDLVHTVDILRYKLGYSFGTSSDKSSEKQERQKWKWIMKGRDNKSYWSNLSTVKLVKDDVIANVSFKKGSNNATAIISSFDMTCIMKAYDIRSGEVIDLTTLWNKKDEAITNPLKDHDPELWEIAQWLRQFNRVQKYWERGIDTRPVARQYLKWIDKCLDVGSIFDSEQAKELYNTYVEQFNEIRPMIVNWLKAKGDDDVE